jgi:hypothetical protein
MKDKYIFFDIETVRQYENLLESPEPYSQQWINFSAKRWPEESPDYAYENYAGLYAEFSRVVVIGVGVFDKQGALRLKAITGEEKHMLTDFAAILGNTSKTLMCGHNINDFDIPFLSKRYIINDLFIPDKINPTGKKPWEINHYDTMKTWGYGQYNSRTSLDLLAVTLGIPSSKGEMDGSKVGDVFYAGDITKIADYCLDDIVTTAQVFLKLVGIDEPFKTSISGN